jgi:hypothetical protein
MLDSYTMAVYGNEWSGRAGKSDRDILLTLASYGRRDGTAAKLGVAVVVSHRDVALAAAVSRRTLRKSIHERLKEVSSNVVDQTS